jgi:hypothetical protein
MGLLLAGGFIYLGVADVLCRLAARAARRRRCPRPDDGVCGRMPTRHCPEDCGALGHCSRFVWAARDGSDLEPWRLQHYRIRPGLPDDAAKP